MVYINGILANSEDLARLESDLKNGTQTAKATMSQNGKIEIITEA